MKFICKFKCFFHGRSLKPGDIVSIPDSEKDSDIVRSSFTPMESGIPEVPATPPIVSNGGGFHPEIPHGDEPKSVEPEIPPGMAADDDGGGGPDLDDSPDGFTVDGDAAELSLDELRRRLDGWGIVYNPKSNAKTLRKIYLQQVNAGQPGQ